MATVSRAPYPVGGGSSNGSWVFTTASNQYAIVSILNTGNIDVNVVIVGVNGGQTITVGPSTPVSGTGPACWVIFQSD